MILRMLGQNGVQYLTKSNVGDTSWGHAVTIGKKCI